MYNTYQKLISGGDIITKKILDKLYKGFMQVHILYHADRQPVFGVWIMQELKEHGYKVGPGTLYPLLASMQQDGLLKMEETLVSGKIRKYYMITEKGKEILKKAKEKVVELTKEITEEQK